MFEQSLSTVPGGVASTRKHHFDHIRRLSMVQWLTGRTMQHKDIERCIAEWQNRNPRTMYREDPREHVFKLRLRSAEEVAAAALAQLGRMRVQGVGCSGRRARVVTSVVKRGVVKGTPSTRSRMHDDRWRGPPSRTENRAACTTGMPHVHAQACA